MDESQNETTALVYRNLRRFPLDVRACLFSDSCSLAGSLRCEYVDARPEAPSVVVFCNDENLLLQIRAFKQSGENTICATLSASSQ